MKLLSNLKCLCNARGVTGDESEVAAIIYELARPYADEILIDALGNIIALKKGKNSNKRIMVSAHIDEVGFYINYILDDGLLRFTADGIDRRVINGRRVLVG